MLPDEAAMERYWHIGRENWLQFVLPAFNVAPTAKVPVIRRGADGQLEVSAARWGLIPHWWKQERPPSLTFNARSEEAAGKPMWRGPMRSQRCLMPAGGWYEWQVIPGMKSKQPTFIHPIEGEVLAFAALWSNWHRSAEDTVLSCALLTKAAAPGIAHIHDRMPVVLRPQHCEEWLDPGTSPERIQAIIADAAEEFEAYAVSPQYLKGSPAAAPQPMAG